MSFGQQLKTNFSKEIEVHICLFGDSECGKSSIINNFCNKQFNQNQVIDFKDQVVELLHSNERFLIQECSNQDKLPKLCKANTNLIIASDLIKVKSNPTEESNKITSYLKQFQQLSTHVILIGTKSDLLTQNQLLQYEKEIQVPSQNESTQSSSQRDIQPNSNEQKSSINNLRRSSSIQIKKQFQMHPSQILKRIADQFGIHYIESSSKNNSNINLIFQLCSGNLQTELFMRDFQQGMINQVQTQSQQNKSQSNLNKDAIHLNNSDKDDTEDNCTYYSTCF